MNVCHCWLAQQWTPGTRFTLLDEPAVAHGAAIVGEAGKVFHYQPKAAEP
jgi:hypothetical protein